MGIRQNLKRRAIRDLSERGWSADDIAQALGVSARTVSNHRARKRQDRDESVESIERYRDEVRAICSN